MWEWQYPKVRSRADRQAEANRLEMRRGDLNQRLRLAFIEGAEEQSQRELGRPLTDEELRRILARYPGDPPERGEG